MKKFISLIIALVCMFSLFACEGGGVSKTIRELTPSGEEIQAEDMRTLVAERQETYLEEDLAKAEESKDKWFDMEVKMSVLMEENEAVSEVFYKIDGKIGFVDMSELVMDLDVVLEAKDVSYAEDGSEVVVTAKINGTLIMVDGMAYIDVTSKEVGPDGEKEEHVKQMGELEEVFDYMEIEDILSLIGDPTDDEGSIYGVNVNGILDMVAGSVGVTYYAEDDKIFIDARETMEESGIKTESVIQYAVEYKRNSAIVKSTKVYMRNYLESSYDDGVETFSSIMDMKIGMQVKQIASANVSAPNTEGYEKI